MTPAVELRWWCFPGVPESAARGTCGSQCDALKEQRRQDCARRHWRSYKGRPAQRQRFPARNVNAGQFGGAW
jgi:hypothetical protein